MRKTLLLFTVLLFGLQGWATTFTVDSVTYTITDATNKTVAIGTGTSTAAINSSTVGTFTIPSSVNYNGDDYAVTAIGDNAFFGCRAITSISIPTTITSIGYDAFFACLGLKSIVIPTSVTTICPWAFYFSGLESVSIPSTVTSISVGAFAEIPGLITVDSNNPNYSSRDGVLYNKSQTVLMQCPTYVAQVTIPNTVTSIAVSAFQGCSNLRSIIIPNTVTSIEFNAFENCTNLTAINIPGSVTSIEVSAFSGCSKLSSITVDSDNQNYSSLDGVLFNKVQTILLEYPGGKKDKSYTIPNSVNSIRDYAFEQTFVKEITIPSSINSIGRCTFINTGLTSIYISTLPLNVNLGDYVFGSFNASQCNLYVPANSRALFAAADQWKDFVNIVEAAAYTVSATTNPTSAGLISGTGSFLKGSTCSLTAKPTSGYTFISWTDKKGTLLTNSPTLSSILVTQDTIFTANYTPSANAAKITIASNNTAAGTVSGSNGNYYTGTTQTITATVNTGYTFANWADKKGNVVSQSPVFSFTLTQDTLLIANFTINKYNITIDVNTATGGSVTGVGSYDYYSSQNVTATPNNGYGFKSWINKKGTVLSTSKSYSFTLTKDTVLTANFSKTYDFVDNNGLYYKISSPTTAYVTYRNSAGGDYSGTIVVPSTTTINGTSYNVTAIGDSAFYNCSGLTSISITNSVTSIGKYSFSNCNGLKSIYLPGAITTIGESAFASCFALASFTIPNTVTTIGSSAFNSCTSLTSITIPESVTSIPNYVFSGCSKLVEITIPNSVTSIGGSAFGGCSSLASVTLPNSLKSISNYLFSGCSKLTFIIIPSTVTSIEFSAFYNCINLASITIPSSVTSIGSGAFEYCTGLTSITVDSNNPNYCSVDGVLFNKNKTVLIQYPLGNTQTSYSIPNTVITIGQDAFENSFKLTSVTIPSSVTTINSAAFWSCSGLSSIYATNIDPGKITLDYGVFYALKTSTCTLYVPTGSKTLYAAASQWKAFTTIVEKPLYLISASANTSVGGSIFGATNYIDGALCTLTATPKTGYVFTHWTENGTVVSTNSSYTFTVSAARSLVANFSTVTVAVTQPTATTLSGSITVTPSTGFTYSIDGKTYQSSNEFPYLSIGTYNLTLKNSSDGTVSPSVLAVVNASGVVAANNYQIKASNCTCRDTKDGAIAVTLAKALDYTVTVTATSTGSKQSVMFSGTSYNLKNLPADTYKLVFKIDFLDNYEQSFNVVVTQPDDLSVLKVGAEKSRATYALNGGTNYYVSVNDHTTETQGDQVQVSLVPGENKIKIYTEKLCQGMYEETIYNSESGQISLFPNPTTGKITLGIPGEEESVTAEIISLSGAVELKQKLVVPSSRLVDLDVSDFSSGTYIVKVNGSTVHSSVKMVKK